MGPRLISRELHELFLLSFADSPVLALRLLNISLHGFRIDSASCPAEEAGRPELISEETLLKQSLDDAWIAMKMDIPKQFSGVVEVDETFMGGK